MWKKKLNFSCGVGSQGYLGEIWIRNDIKCGAEGSDFLKVGCITNFNFNISSELQDISTLGQLKRDDNYRKFESTFKRWQLQINQIYLDDDESQIRFNEAIDNGQRIWLKLIPRAPYNARGLRTIHVGSGYLASISMTNNLQTAVSNSVTIIGTGPLEKMIETTSNPITCESVCCEELNETIYLYLNQEFKAPPAPEGSTGWIVEKTFEPIETGTGDIGTIMTSPAPGSPGMLGCPVQVVFRYLCSDSPFIPDTAEPAILQFVEIAENTANPQQVKIIQMMEDLTGMRIDNKTIFPSDLWIEFNNVFLPSNIGFIFDLSGLGLQDLYIVATLTNLTGLNVNFNNISFVDIETIQSLELVYLSATHNLLGQWNAPLSTQEDTLKHLDLSFNFITENFLFSSFVGSVNVTLDFYDMSNNLLAFYINDKLRVKVLRIANNRFPNDNDLGNSYWYNKKGDVDITTQLSTQFPQLMRDFTILEELDLSKMELWVGGSQSDDLTILIAQVATDLGITVAQATPIVKYSPTYTDTLPIGVFDFLALERNYNNA